MEEVDGGDRADDRAMSRGEIVAFTRESVKALTRPTDNLFNRYLACLESLEGTVPDAMFRPQFKELPVGVTGNRRVTPTRVVGALSEFNHVPGLNETVQSLAGPPDGLPELRGDIARTRGSSSENFHDVFVGRVHRGGCTFARSQDYSQPTGGFDELRLSEASFETCLRHPWDPAAPLFDQFEFVHDSGDGVVAES